MTLFLRKSQKGRFLAYLFVFFFFAGIALLGAVLGFIASYSEKLPDISAIEAYRPSETTKIYSSDGQLLASFFIENREIVPFSKIPDSLKLAVLAIEDARFYEHKGVDAVGILRALYENVKGKRIVQGGSTITQQLTRNLFLTQKRTFVRKLQEILLALQLERRYPKDKILELYLNQIYFGEGAYGVQAATQTYFAKDVSKLTLAESAMLAGLPKSPGKISPFANYDAARQRQKVVLDKMAELGFVTYETAEAAKAEKLKLVRGKSGTNGIYRTPYFVTFVRDQLIEEYGAAFFLKGGLRVYTTINLKLQELADKAILDGVSNGMKSGLRISQGALAVVETKTGYVRALVGGTDFKKSQYNRATQATRQPGSAFKPFVYVAALENGYTPFKVLVDGPTSYWIGNRYWSPKNYDHKYRGALTLKSALQWSVNVIAVKLIHELGPPLVMDYAKRLGITTLDPVRDQTLALALGGLTYGVKPIEMASAFASFGNEGSHCIPIAVKRVVLPTGVVLKENPPQCTQVIAPETANTITAMLENVIKGGTGRRAFIGRPAAGKTGTTSEFKDAWFVGYTPDLSCAVWYGNDNNVPTNHVAGGSLPAMTWAKFMRAATKGYPVVDFPGGKLITEGYRKNENISIKEKEYHTEKETSNSKATVEVEICKASGKVANAYCPNIVVRNYEDGKQPGAVCTLHGPAPEHGRTDEHTSSTPSSKPPSSGSDMVEVDICKISGKLATPYCPEVITKTLPRSQVPGSACDIHKGE